jgi:hypothetical protein
MAYLYLSLLITVQLQVSMRSTCLRLQAQHAQLTPSCCQVPTMAMLTTCPAARLLQARLHTLYLECLASAGQWAKVAAHGDAVLRQLPKDLRQGPAGWRAAALAHTGGGRVAQEMTRLKAELLPAAQVRLYSVQACHTHALSCCAAPQRG